MRPKKLRKYQERDDTYACEATIWGWIMATHPSHVHVGGLDTTLKEGIEARRGREGEGEVDFTSIIIGQVRVWNIAY